LLEAEPVIVKPFVLVRLVVVVERIVVVVRATRILVALIVTAMGELTVNENVAKVGTCSFRSDKWRSRWQVGVRRG
jgi:hypothetical protein